jgi:hypothetical protein
MSSSRSLKSAVHRCCPVCALQRCSAVPLGGAGASCLRFVCASPPPYPPLLRGVRRRRTTTRNRSHTLQRLLRVGWLDVSSPSHSVQEGGGDVLENLDYAILRVGTFPRRVNDATALGLSEYFLHSLARLTKRSHAIAAKETHVQDALGC